MQSLSRLAQAAALVAASPSAAVAQDARNGGTAGGAALWIFANLSYAAMRAQGNPSGWRILCFIFGFPGTLLSLLVVEENGERMYGFDLPKKRR